MTPPALLDEWAAVLERRPTFRGVLAPYTGILKAWARGPGVPVPSLDWSAEACGERWRRGVPLLAEAPASIPVEAMEEAVAAALGVLAAAGEDGETLRRFAEAWDGGAIEPPALFPRRGRFGSEALPVETGLSPDSLGFVAYSGLRPVLETYFADSRRHLTAGIWDLGVCPFCGSPPGFADLGEDGKRQLVCHCCGGTWGFSRLRCPYCDTRRPDELVRLQGEDREEGYLLDACGSCRGYVKSLDRRVRWNAGPALVEDWGSPHLDLLARRKEYWRAVPTLIELQRSLPA